jgi:HK97 family phage major capsid protein
MSDTEIAPRASREVVIALADRAAGDTRIPVVVSTDAPVPMHDCIEVLCHTTDAIDLSRAPLPIVVTHRQGQVNVGIVEDLVVTNGQLRGFARFGTRDEAVGYCTDVLNGTLRSVSVGYGRMKAIKRGGNLMETIRWQPTHVAIVAEPADGGAGFFRAAVAHHHLEIEDQVTTTSAEPAAPLENSNMSLLNQAAAGVNAETTGTTAATTTNAAGNAAAPAAQGSGVVEAEASRCRAIENLCRSNQIDDNLRNIWITGGTSVERVSAELLLIQQQRAKNLPTVNGDSVAKLGLGAGETRRYSLMNAIRAVADKNWSGAGFELECSQEIAKRLNTVTDVNKFFVPFEVQGRQMRSAHGSMMTPNYQRQMNRDLTSGTTTAGGFLVGTDNMSFIEVLRNRSVAYRMGARRLSGLVGNVTVPRQTAAATAYWLSTEATQATESQQTFGQMSLSPKTVGAYTEISRQLMLQSSPDAESIVTGDLGAVAGLAIDVGVLRGSGTSGEPTGIVNTAGIGSVTGTTLGYPGILEFQTDIATANVMPVAGGYVTTPTVAALMMQRVKFSSTASPLWEGNVWDGQMSGFQAMSSNQMSAATMLYGDWAQVIVGEWGVLQVEVNPYANFQAGIIGVRALVSVDVGLRYAAAFSLASTIT